MNESKQLAKELRSLASKDHLGSGGHLSGHERSRQAQEHVNPTYLQAQTENRKTWVEVGLHEIDRGPKEEDIAALAYQLWQLRSCPDGSPDEDWYCALEALRARSRPQ